MGKRVSSDEMQNIFKILQKSYDVYGPKIYQGTGCFSDTDVVRYGLLEQLGRDCLESEVGLQL